MTEGLGISTSSAGSIYSQPGSRMRIAFLAISPPGDESPVVAAIVGGFEVSWDVHRSWTCACGEREDDGACCAHIRAAAVALHRSVANRLISARRAAGYTPHSPNSVRTPKPITTQKL